MTTATFRIWRGNAQGGDFQEYDAEIEEGMVVLDAVRQIQAEAAGDLALRWNCKAGKCGSCSAEVNGMPSLMCMKRLKDLPDGRPIDIQPLKTFPIVTGLSSGTWFMRVMHISRGMPLTSAEHEPHLPALQFQRNARS